MVRGNMRSTGKFVHGIHERLGHGSLCSRGQPCSDWRLHWVAHGRHVVLVFVAYWAWPKWGFRSAGSVIDWRCRESGHAGTKTRMTPSAAVGETALLHPRERGREGGGHHGSQRLQGAPGTQPWVVVGERRTLIHRGHRTAIRLCGLNK